MEDESVVGSQAEGRCEAPLRGCMGEFQARPQSAETVVVMQLFIAVGSKLEFLPAVPPAP